MGQIVWLTKSWFFNRGWERQLETGSWKSPMAGHARPDCAHTLERCQHPCDTKAGRRPATAVTEFLFGLAPGDLPWNSPIAGRDYLPHGGYLQNKMTKGNNQGVSYHGVCRRLMRIGLQRYQGYISKTPDLVRAC